MSNVPPHIQSYFDSLLPMFALVDEILDDWTGEGCYKLPELLDGIAAHFSWDEKTLRSKDPIIRDYLRNHPKWLITRGAYGGIMRAVEKQKKEELKIAKEQAKEDVRLAIENEIAKKRLIQENKSIKASSSSELTKQLKSIENLLDSEDDDLEEDVG